MIDVSSTMDIDALHRMIDSIAAKIPSIMATHAEAESAHADKLEAQITLVTAMLELARPTARALGTRPKIFESHTLDVTARTSERAIWRGLNLTYPLNEEPGPAQITTAQDVNAGSYWGGNVFLREDGRLVKLAYAGSWKGLPRLHGEWRATEQEIPVEVFCRDWSRSSDPKQLAVQLLGFMDATGDRRKPTAKAHEAANKFRAIVTLL